MLQSQHLRRRVAHEHARYRELPFLSIPPFLLAISINPEAAWNLMKVYLLMAQTVGSATIALTQF
jgi:hypothetical protein